MEVRSACLCCLSRPAVKHLRTPHIRGLDGSEVYWTLLASCFNIHLLLESDESGICSECAGRLRDASDFKRQVQRCQAELRERLESAVPIKDEEPTVKSETDGGEETAAGDEVSLPGHVLARLPPRVWAHARRQLSAACVVRLERLRARSEHVAADTSPPHTNTNKKTGTGSNTYICDACNKRFKHKSVLKEHIAVHTGRTRYGCGTCGKPFVYKSSLMKHAVLHSGRKPYSCDICHKQFSFKGNLKVHTRLHTGEKPHKCQTCDKGFYQTSALKLHYWRFHTNRKLYHCEICNKTFIRQESLNEHMLAHSGDKRHGCGICNKQFVTKQRLIAHAKIHNDNYVCEICNLRFPHKRALNTHSKTHGEPIQYTCDICKKQFPLKSRIKKHMKTHEPKPFFCGVCDMRFREQASLDAHHRAHAGLRCGTCREQFSTKSALNKHVRDQHGQAHPGGNLDAHASTQYYQQNPYTFMNQQIPTSAGYHEPFGTYHAFMNQELHPYHGPNYYAVINAGVEYRPWSLNPVHLVPAHTPGHRPPTAHTLANPDTPRASAGYQRLDSCAAMNGNIRTSAESRQQRPSAATRRAAPAAEHPQTPHATVNRETEQTKFVQKIYVAPLSRYF